MHGFIESGNKYLRHIIVLQKNIQELSEFETMNFCTEKFDTMAYDIYSDRFTIIYLSITFVLYPFFRFFENIIFSSEL